MWKQIVSIDKKMKTYGLYRMLTLMPRMIYRILIAIKKKVLRWKRKFDEWVESVRKRIQYLQSEQYRLEQIDKHMKEGRFFPLVSVVMPVYNAEEYLNQGIQSLLDQSLEHFELICVDDGSTDSSLKILREFASKDQRIRVFTQKNKYAGVARNLGMAKARGEYLVFLDSDDYFEADLLKNAYYKAAVNKADIVLYGANYDNVSLRKSGRARWLLDVSLAPEQQPFSYKDCPEHIYQMTTACPWTKMFRRKFIRKTCLKFQHLYNANDVFFVYSALAMADRIVTLDEALVNYRMGMKTNLQSSSRRYFYEAYSAWKEKLIQLGAFETVKQSYVNAALSSTLYNLRVVKDEDAKRELFHKIKQDILIKLEISGHDADYYYDKKKYAEMCLILEGTFEQYLMAQNQ